MKILMVGHFIPYPPHGGSAQRNFNLQRELAREHTLHAVTFNDPLFLKTDAEIRNAIEGMRECWHDARVFPVPTEVRRLRLYPMLVANLASPESISEWRFRSRSFGDEIGRRVRTCAYDLVYFDTIALAQYVRLIGELPAILNHHNVESTLMLRRAKSERNPLARLYLLVQGHKLRRRERMYARQFKLHVTVSELDSAELVRHCGPIRVRVIPNGTDVEYFAPRGSSAGAGLVYTGGMTWYPNRDAMSYFCRRIYPVIKANEPSVSMTIIGREPPSDVVDASRRDPSIRLEGWVDDVRTHVARAAVYVVPIRVGGGTRLKILDAMAQGRAVVSTSIGCEGLEVTPDEDIVVADNAVGFAEAVIRVLRDEPLRRRLEAKARKLVVDRYSWPVIGRRQSEAFAEAVSLR